MPIKNIKIIVGSNYGDEGKGLATDYFCNPSEKWLGVLTNGTSQRAHTVDTIDGKHHVFSHFSSGTFQGADTYISEYFAINPITFVNEYLNLQNKFGITPNVYIHPDCKIITPFDILANLTEREQSGLHNTCGNGFWKTLERYKDGYGMGRVSYFRRNDASWMRYLNNIEDYYKTILKNIDLDFNGIKAHFINDLQFMLEHSLIIGNEIFKTYPNIIFENGQGLLIGEQQFLANWDFCTPSDTGMGYAYKIIEKSIDKADVEVCYVSRTYLTRHGDGGIFGECGIEDINKTIIDYTNIPNKCQGKLRFGYLDDEQLITRIWKDSNFRELKQNNYKCSLMLTHWNEKQIELGNIKTCNLFNGKIYVSDGKTKESVRSI